MAIGIGGPFIALAAMLNVLHPMQDSSKLQYFPLAVGNLWQYYYDDGFGNGYLETRYVFIADTVLPNGRSYYGVRITSISTSPEGIKRYYRIDSLFRVLEYSSVYGDTCGGFPEEKNFYRLLEPDSSIWRICDNPAGGLIGPPYLCRFNGISAISVFNSAMLSMEFQVGGKGWLGDSTIDRRSPRFILVNGIGAYREESSEGPFHQLLGAKIGNRTYGKIVNVVDEQMILPLDARLERIRSGGRERIGTADM